MKNLVFLLIIFFYTSGLHAQRTPYVPGLLVVKFSQQEQKGGASLHLNEALLQADNSILAVNKVLSSENELQKGGKPSILSGIYKIALQNGISEEAYLEYLNSFSNVQYAEPYPNVFPLYVPNDPQAKIGAAQQYLEQIKAYLAWDITQGDATKVIGIIDTGVDLDHEDLLNNLYLNNADPIDGVDNDGDGYIDNYYGWDFADDDRLPEADSSPHGTGVAGIAAAATNNNKGMAGVGFNTSFMPIKIFKSGSNFSRNSYEAIIYAADQGCDVINLSWGNTGRYSQYAQDVIDYAVLEKDVVVVAAAGNTNEELNFFPASYNHVTSVSWVDSNDEKAPHATFSDFIDLVAPGINIYTTQNNDAYSSDGGSSYAAPMVAGAAALIRAVHPDWNALQVMEQLRINSDDIYGVGNNADYRYKFGKGRLNVFKALADFDDPSIRISDVQYTNGLEEAAYFGDTLSVTVEFTNYLAATENVAISLTSESPYVTIINNGFAIPSLANLEQTSNSSAPFKVVLSNDLPENEAINFRLLMEGEFYNDYQSFQIQSSPKIRIFNFNNWQFGFTATGNVGRSFETPYSNYALYHKGQKLLDHFGIVVAAAADSISHNTAIQPLEFNYLEKFESYERLKRYSDITADLDVRSVLKEQDTISNPLGVYVQQRLLGWETAEDENYLLLKYKLMNRGALNFDTLYFQFLADWAINGQEEDILLYDSASQMSYAFNPDENTFMALAILGSHDSTFYALDFASANGNSTDLINDSLKNRQLWDFVNDPFGKVSAGAVTPGNNVAGLQGIRLLDFLSGDSKELTLALLTGASLQELREALTTAKAKNDQVPANPPLGKQVQVCLNDAPQVEAPQNSAFKIYSSALTETTLYEGQLFEPGTISKDTTFYFEMVDSLGFVSDRKRMLFNITKPNAFFEITEKPFLLTPGETNTYQFTDASIGAVSWQWDFGNGFQSVRQNPKIVFDEAGTFAVQLIVQNEIGCADTLSRTLETAWRSATPQISSVEICKNEQLSLQDEALAEIVVFSDSAATNEIFRGASFLTSPIEKDTVFYIRNEAGVYPSEIIAVNVLVIPLKAAMELRTDINSAIDSLVVFARDLSKYQQETVWLLGGEEIGRGQEVAFNPMQLKTKSLQLVALSQSGCADTAIFSGSASVNPEFDNYFACPNTDLLIEAKNSAAVYYFADSALTEFLGKGKAVNISNISSTTKVFAVNVADIFPSEIVEVPIRLSQLSAAFSMSTDTLNLAYENEVSLTAQSEAAVKWLWNYGEGTESTGEEITATFNAPGVYTVQLSVQDSSGCTESFSKSLVVFDDPLLGNEQEKKSFFSVFPNPANQFIHLKGKTGFKFETLKIIDLSGKLVYSQQNDKPIQRTEVISVSELKSGTYFLIIEKGRESATFMFIINR